MTAYRQGERQEAPRQGGHGRRFASNGQTVNCLPCSAVRFTVQRTFCIHLVRPAARSIFRSRTHACAADSDGEILLVRARAYQVTLQFPEEVVRSDRRARGGGALHGKKYDFVKLYVYVGTITY